MVLFEKRGREGRAKGATQTEYDLDDPALKGLIEADLYEQLMEEVELLQVRQDRSWSNQCLVRFRVLLQGLLGMAWKAGPERPHGSLGSYSNCPFGRCLDHTDRTAAHQVMKPPWF